MITRIVKLEFEEDKVQEFLDFFDTVKSVVNGFPGCAGMKLYTDVENPTIIMTYSYWESTEDLERYRKSSEFGRIWPTIKPWFCSKPEAWTLRAYFNGFEQKNRIN